MTAKNPMASGIKLLLVDTSLLSIFGQKPPLIYLDST